MFKAENRPLNCSHSYICNISLYHVSKQDSTLEQNLKDRDFLKKMLTHIKLKVQKKTYRKYFPLTNTWKTWH